MYSYKHDLHRWLLIDMWNALCELGYLIGIHFMKQYLDLNSQALNRIGHLPQKSHKSYIFVSK